MNFEKKNILVFGLARSGLAVIDLLIAKGYDMIDNDVEYKYLVKMPMDSVSEENVEKIINQKGEKEAELSKYQKMKPTDLWNQELDELLEML